MKGIILETSGKEAVVLCDNGTVSKIKNKHYGKGQVVKMNNKFKFIAKAGSIVALFAITAATSFAYTAPSTYVSLDVNPSIEYKLNAFDRVISVVAVNDDGEKVVNELDVKNEKITKAVLHTINKLKEQGYLTEDEYAGIVIAVSNKNEKKSDKLTNEIKDEIDKYEEEKVDVKSDEEEHADEKTDEEESADVQSEDEEKTYDEEKNDGEDVKKEDENEDQDKDNEDKESKDDKESVEPKDNIQIIVESVGRERVEEARKLNVTPGKLNLVQKLIASTDEFDDINEEQLNELLELSVKEINKMTKACRKGMDVEFNFKSDDLSENTEDEDLKYKDVNKDKEKDKDKDEYNEKADDKEEKEDKGNNKYGKK